MTEVLEILEKIEEIRQDVCESCQCGHHGLSSFGGSILATLANLEKAVRSGENLADTSAQCFGNPHSGYQYESEIFHLAVEAGCMEDYDE